MLQRNLVSGKEMLAPLSEVSMVNFMCGSREFKWLKNMSICFTLLYRCNHALNSSTMGLGMLHCGHNVCSSKVHHIDVSNNGGYWDTNGSPWRFWQIFPGSKRHSC